MAVSIYGCPYGMVMYVASLVAGKCNTLVSSCPFSRLGGSRNVPHVTRDRVVGVAPAVWWPLVYPSPMKQRSISHQPIIIPRRSRRGQNIEQAQSWNHRNNGWFSPCKWPPPLTGRTTATSNRICWFSPSAQQTGSGCCPDGPYRRFRAVIWTEIHLATVSFFKRHVLLT